MSFVHLHVHSEYSLLDGASRIRELCERASELKMEALALSDHGAMYGVVEFYKACKSVGIKPILGMEAYIAPRSLGEKQGKMDREYAHFVLLAKNNTGYQNLMKLSSVGFLEGFYYKPRIDYDTLAKYSEGLIGLSACLAGDIPRLLSAGRYDDAKTLALRLNDIFNGDFYIELQDHGIMEQRQILPSLVRLSEETGIGAVATNDVHYVFKEDAKAQDVLLCVQTAKFIDDVERMKMDGEEYYLKSPAEMSERFADFPNAIENTLKIAQQCDVEIVFGQTHLPGFDAPKGKTNPQYLSELCYKGLARKIPNAGAAERERIDYELGVIEKMGYVDYFLIVWDFVDYAKRNGIAVGPGRGSAAGALCAYCLDITDVNPIEHGLLFERFLNPERISMPDIDIDFCYERRQEVIDYVVAKYGTERVAQIVTFGTMAARAVIRDVGRVLRIPYKDVDRIAKLVPFEIGMTLERALTVSGDLRAEYEGNDEIKRLIDLGRRLEGLPRHASTHAAGVVISKLPVVEYVPLQKNDEAVTTQFTMGTLEELGILKMDFLGLRTLTVIRDTLRFIEQSGQTPPNLEQIGFDDPAVYKLISAGDTDGVFQFEGGGMRQFLTQLKPGTFEDIIAGISLFRPGPMDQIPRYVACKHDPSKVVYTHEKLKPILQNTYGCMVYQEQVMQIVRELAGYSLGRSDLVRRAMSKKKADVMAREREYFIHGKLNEDGNVDVPGAVANGVSEKTASRIFDEMMDFASYAFNKSHAAAYAVIAYRTAYLKAHHKVPFMAALINSFMQSTDKVAEYIYSCKTHGIELLPPDINKSAARFMPEGDAIRFGLAAIKNVGLSAVEAIVTEREQNGPFLDLNDFLQRCVSVNKRLVESLIKAGCFDALGTVKRSQMLSLYPALLDAANSERKSRASGQLSLFELESVPKLEMAYPPMNEFPQRALLAMEKEVTGIYLSGHPLLEYQQALSRFRLRISDVLAAGEPGSVSAIGDNSRVALGGIITAKHTKVTKSGSGLMAYLTLEDLTGSIELIVFPSALQKFGAVLTEDSIVAVRGRVNIKEDERPSIVLDEAGELSAAQTPKLYISVPGDRLGEVAPLLSRHKGSLPVMLFDPATQKLKTVPSNLYVEASEAFMAEARTIFGADNVKMV